MKITCPATLSDYRTLADNYGLKVSQEVWCHIPEKEGLPPLGEE
jgi:hypothetical protein